MKESTEGAKPQRSSTDSERDIELLLFKCLEAYVYRVPPAGTVGHRAELWNVDRWLAEVHVRIIRFGNDEASIRLSDPKTLELYAECPITLPLRTCVEPVVDSSRYFVLRIVDTQNDKESGRHVFLGLGFRERSEASDFTAALADHVGYLNRKEEAAAMRQAFDDAYKEEYSEEENGENNTKPRTFVDYSLKPGEKLVLNPTKLGGAFSSSITPKWGKLTKTFSLIFDKSSGTTAGPMAALAPPPQTRFSEDGSLHQAALAKPAMSISPSHARRHSDRSSRRDGRGGELEEDAGCIWGDFEEAPVAV